MVCHRRCVRNAGFLLTYSSYQEELIIEEPQAAPLDPNPIKLGSVTPNWYTIGLEHNFGGPTQDIAVRLNGVLVDPMEINPDNGLHYGTVWVPLDTPTNITLVDPGGQTRGVVHDFGAHDGADDASVLTDSTKSWPVNGFVGQQIRNLTDNSSGKITANTATTITATLSGGTDNDWDIGDKFWITPRSLADLVTPTAIRTRYVGPEVAPAGGDFSELDPGNLADACTDEATGDKIILFQGSRAAPSVILPYAIGDLSLTSAATDGQIVAEDGESPLISAFKQGAIVWTDESVAETPGLYSTPTFEADQSCMFVVIDGEYQRVPHRADLAHMDPKRYYGTHDGSSGASVLTDSTQSWDASEFEDRSKSIFNLTDGSFGKITASTATTISHSEGLSGGTDNDWDAGDVYLLVPYDSSGWTIDTGKLYVRATVAQWGHDGSDDSAVLVDSTANWSTDEHVGRILWNLTDGSSGTITANNATTVTATLTGGTDDNWDTGDIYMIVMDMEVELAKIPDAFQDILFVLGDRWHIDGISFEGCGAGASQQKDALTVRGNESLVQNCHFEGIQTRAIVADSNEKIMIRNCVFKDRTDLMPWDDAKNPAGGASQFSSEHCSTIYVDDARVYDIHGCTFDGLMDAVDLKSASGECFDINVHDNTCINILDEMLNWDGMHRQIRRWRNVGTNMREAVAMALGEGGPYIFVNERMTGVGKVSLLDELAHNSQTSLTTIKFAIGTIGQMKFYNCTFADPLYDPTFFPGTQVYSWRCNTGHVQTAVKMRNCIWATYGHGFFDQDTTNADKYDLDYNIWYTSNLIGESSNLFRWNDTPVGDFAGFQAASGQEVNGLGSDPLLVGGIPSVPIAGLFLPGISNNAILGLSSSNRGAQ